MKKMNFIKTLKKKSVLFVFSLFILLGVCVFLYKIPFFSNDYEKVKTKSGLTILFMEDKSLPFIKYSISFFKAGADYNFKNKSGLSTLTAYLMEQGAGGLSSEKLQKELNQLGIALDIDVGRQSVDFTLSGLSWHGEKIWDLFVKVLTEPHFQKEELDILRKQLLDRRLKKLDGVGFVASEVWKKSIFSNAFGEPMDGSIQSLKDITLEDIKEFYKKQIYEGEPLLSVVGQYNKELKKKIISFFEKNFSYQAKKDQKEFFPNSKAQGILLTKKDLVQAKVILGYPISSFPVDNPREFLTLRVANYILSGGMSSRLFIGLREEKSLTYGAYSRFLVGKFYGYFVLSGSTKTISVRAFLKETLVILKKFHDRGVHLEEFQRTKQSLKSQFLQDRETSEDRLNQIAYYNYYLGVKPKFLKNYLNILKDISMSEVNRMIKKFILSKPLHVVVYGHPSLQTQLKDLEGFPALQTISFEDYFKEDLNSSK